MISRQKVKNSVYVITAYHLLMQEVLTAFIHHIPTKG